MSGPSKVTIRKARWSTDRDTLKELHVLTFPGDLHEDYSIGTWWLAEDTSGAPVGFAGMRTELSWPGSVYFSRVGVIPPNRGKGLQHRLVRAVLRTARRQGFSRCISTTFENPPSANNMIRCGFKTYLPQEPWGYPGTIYWLKPL